MAIVPVPSLSMSGWTTNTVEKADFLLSHFFESDKAQSYLYRGNIANLQFIIEEHGDNFIAMCDKIRQTLESYLSRYYPRGVVVDVSNNASEITSNEVTLRIYCRAIEDDGKEVVFGKMLNVKDTKFSKIMSLNNEGDAQ